MVQIIAIENQTAKRAMQIARQNGGNIEYGIMMSLRAKLLLEKLQTICHFEFIKASTGELREAWGTLAPNFIGSKVKGVQKQKNPNCICFWDVEKGAFRSCLISNITKIY